jgi:hypothetical protein
MEWHSETQWISNSHVSATNKWSDCWRPLRWCTPENMEGEKENCGVSLIVDWSWCHFSLIRNGGNCGVDILLWLADRNVNAGPIPSNVLLSTRAFLFWWNGSIGAVRQNSDEFVGTPARWAPAGTLKKPFCGRPTVQRDVLQRN